MEGCGCGQGAAKRRKRRDSGLREQLGGKESPLCLCNSTWEAWMTVNWFMHEFPAPMAARRPDMRHQLSETGPRSSTATAVPSACDRTGQEREREEERQTERQKRSGENGVRRVAGLTGSAKLHVASQAPAQLVRIANQLLYLLPRGHILQIPKLSMCVLMFLCEKHGGTG